MFLGSGVDGMVEVDGQEFIIEAASALEVLNFCDDSRRSVIETPFDHVSPKCDIETSHTPGNDGMLGITIPTTIFASGHRGHLKGD